ncbi:MAG: glycosyltransferase family 8 protein [Clostridiales bacterium]|nr:glycosyltransferase family 8 protein [Clostridiales bacterium]
MNTRIEIAFCFDEKMVYPAFVAIASLLDFKKDINIHYDISCICSEMALNYEKEINTLVKKRDEESTVKFYRAPEQFSGAFEVRGITVSTYLRLLLHRVLPHNKKIIYADVDVLFQDSLKEMWETDISDCLLAGVKGANNFKDTWKNLETQAYGSELKGLEGKYINAGILLMNLEKIRMWNPDEQWLQMSCKGYHYQDQDILNITCKDKIKFLDIRFNIQAHLEKKDFKAYARQNIYSEESCNNAWKYPVILHYTGQKPWCNRGVNRGKLWWQYVESQEDLKVLFNKKQTPNRKTTGFVGKINRHLPF